MDLGQLMQGLQAFNAPQAAALGQRVGISPDQVGAILGHLGGQASAGVTDPTQAAAAAAHQNGVSPDVVGQLMGLLQGAGGAGNLMGTVTAMLDQNKDGSVLDELMGMAGGLLTRK